MLNGCLIALLLLASAILLNVPNSEPFAGGCPIGILERIGGLLVDVLAGFLCEGFPVLIHIIRNIRKSLQNMIVLEPVAAAIILNVIPKLIPMHNGPI